MTSFQGSDQLIEGQLEEIAPGVFAQWDQIECGHQTVSSGIDYFWIRFKNGTSCYVRGTERVEQTVEYWARRTEQDKQSIAQPVQRQLPPEVAYWVDRWKPQGRA
jgi:hypothetical protein